MAISDTQKVDLIYKKLFGATKTDLATNKSPSNEAIASRRSFAVIQSGFNRLVFLVLQLL